MVMIAAWVCDYAPQAEGVCLARLIGCTATDGTSCKLSLAPGGVCRRWPCSWSCLCSWWRCCWSCSWSCLVAEVVAVLLLVVQAGGVGLQAGAVLLLAGVVLLLAVLQAEGAAGRLVG